MILIFGGTTEGRIAASVCDAAGKPYYYATKGALQKMELANGIHITGALTKEDMISFCKEKAVRVIVNAAHPFAENLHKNITAASLKLNIPVVRLERRYTNQNNNLLWFDSYTDATLYLLNNGITNLLALTGVNTIAKLKPYWLKHNTIFRILDREESRTLATNGGFPLEKIIYYNPDEAEYPLFERLKPQAIITKESGDSGRFDEKVAAALQLNIPLLVVKRPSLSPSFKLVYGEHGLRKEIEHLLPDFFSLRTGYTTGVCATAATKAALMMLLTKEAQKIVAITLPQGEEVKIPIEKTEIEKDEATCWVIKDAGDDPDITNGEAIVSTVRLTSQHTNVRFLQGEGVGKVTLPGLGLEIGEPAINHTPRKMMQQEIAALLNGVEQGVDVTISVPNGKELAKRTFNPKLGIVDGISILGTSGIVRPFSSDAFVASIRREMEVAKALGCTHIVINSGAKSERIIKQQYKELPPQAFIHFGNFIGETIKIATQLEIPNLTLGIMIGKAVKLAEGSLDTHSKKVVMNINFLVDIARECGCSQATIEAIKGITLARQLWEIIPTTEKHYFSAIQEKCYKVCKPLLPTGNLTIVLMGEESLT